MRITTALLASILLATGSCNGSVADGGGGGGGTTDAGITLTMDSFQVPSGAEVYKCQDFANPFGGGDAQVAEFESHMTKGSHHMLLFYKDGAANGALEDCSGLEFAPTPYSTQLPDDAIQFPTGVAALIPKTTGLRVQSHYLNTTGATITAQVQVTFHLAPQGSVMQQAGVLFVVQPDIDIPPLTTAHVTYDCAIPQDMSVIKAGSHMHKHGTNFVATVAGDTIVQTTQWDDPAPAKFSPPRVLKAGDPLHFDCTFVNNDPTKHLKFGESANTNEMCIFVGSFYPVPAGKATIGCQ